MQALHVPEPCAAPLWPHLKHRWLGTAAAATPPTPPGEGEASGETFGPAPAGAVPHGPVETVGLR